MIGKLFSHFSKELLDFLEPFYLRTWVEYNTKKRKSWNYTQFPSNRRCRIHLRHYEFVWNFPSSSSSFFTLFILIIFQHFHWRLKILRQSVDTAWNNKQIHIDRNWPLEISSLLTRRAFKSSMADTYHLSECRFHENLASKVKDTRRSSDESGSQSRYYPVR